MRVCVLAIFPGDSELLQHNGSLNILTFSLYGLFPNGLFTLFLSDAVFNSEAFSPRECCFVKAGLTKSSPSAEGRKKKRELNQGRKGERSDTRGGTQNTTLTATLRETVRNVHGVGLLRDKYADWFS